MISKKREEKKMSRKGKREIRPRPNPLVTEMGRVIEKLLDSRKDDEEVARLIPNVDFFLDYVILILRYRATILSRKEDEELEKKIDQAERMGVGLGFALNRLIATNRALAERTSSFEETEEWKTRIQKIRSKT